MKEMKIEKKYEWSAVGRDCLEIIIDGEPNLVEIIKQTIDDEIKKNNEFKGIKEK